MFGRLLLIGLLGLGLWWGLRWFRRAPPSQVAAILRKSFLWGGIGLLTLLALTGRLSPLFAAAAAAVPVISRILNLLQMLPAIQQLLRMFGLSGFPGRPPPAGGSATGQVSSIHTRFLAMTLDHDTGDMDGEVLEGAFRGQSLSALELGQLLELLRRYRLEDGQSAALLEAYLEQTRGEAWREAAAGERPAEPPEAAMNRAEALAVLGLPWEADDQAVRAAHRRLMQRLHPDRGGSDYLAAKLNEAKQVLLGD